MALCQDVDTSVSFVEPKMTWPGYSSSVKRSGTMRALMARSAALCTGS